MNGKVSHSEKNLSLTDKEILETLVEHLDMKTLRVLKLLLAIRSLSTGSDADINRLAQRAIDTLSRPDLKEEHLA